MAASYWQSCVDEIDHQADTLTLREKNAFHEIRYERLCENPAAVIERLASFLGCQPDLFDFDLSTIHSMDFKIGNPNDDRWVDLLDRIRPTMTRKGYL
jgi:hypothetical protein